MKKRHLKKIIKKCNWEEVDKSVTTRELSNAINFWNKLFKRWFIKIKFENTFISVR
jgi:hypothetical protein